jgi:hypothetical protein
MATKPRDRVAGLVKDVEATAKRLRTEVRKRANATGLQKNLEKIAAQLRKRAAEAAGQVEKYVHELRKELEGKAGASTKKAKRATRKTSTRKTSTRKTAKRGTAARRK